MGTQSERVSDTVEFYPHNAIMPASSSNDRLIMILTDLLDVLKHPHPASPILRLGTDINDAIRTVERLVRTGTNARTVSDIQAPPPTAPPNPPPSLEPTLQFPIGTIIRKQFDQRQYEGEIISYDPINKYYKVQYRDRDIEEFTTDEIKKISKAAPKICARAPTETNF